ncbi:gluconate kinase 1 [compost metagenome]
MLKQRLAERAGHFFDPSLLQTQLDTLEEPDVHEAITIDIALTPEQIVVQVMQKLGVTDSVCRG